jgi:hypothetical protein
MERRSSPGVYRVQTLPRQAKTSTPQPGEYWSPVSHKPGYRSGLGGAEK